MNCDASNVFLDLVIEPVLTGLASAVWLIVFVKLADIAKGRWQRWTAANSEEPDND